MPFWAIFGVFWDLAKKRHQRFFLNSAKMCQKDITVISPGKMQFSELFTEL
jgi:hypothetical protein